MDVELSQAELERYGRQLSLTQFGQRGQEQIKQARTLVVGAGPLGACAAGQLASVGLGYIGVVDGGKLSAADLPSQTTYLASDIGAGKADCLCSKLGQLNPEVQLDAYPVELGEHNADAIVVGHDLVLSCIADADMRLLLNDTCIAGETPLIDCAVHGDRASIQLVRPGQDACLRCRGLEASDSSAVAPGLPALAGTLAAVEAVALIAGVARPQAGRSEIEAWSGDYSRLELERRPDCEACASIMQTAEAAR